MTVKRSTVKRDQMPRMLPQIKEKNMGPTNSPVVHVPLQSKFPIPDAPGVPRAVNLFTPVKLPAISNNKATYVQAHDRQVKVLLSMNRTPRVMVFEGLLSDEECDEMVERSRPKLKRSMTVKPGEHGEEVHPDRTSEGTFFTNEEYEGLNAIHKRIEALVNWPLENSELLQILNYQPGAQYLPHNDYFDPNDLGSSGHLMRGGNRVGTLICYLNTCPEGGGTVFPNLGLTVSPAKGNAVFFTYDSPTEATNSLHGGEPVISGEKWIFTRWFRTSKFI